MIEAALSGLIGAVLGAAITTICGEDFRRFRDRQAVAGALAGEIDSILAAIPELHVGLKDMVVILKEGGKLPLPEFPQPSSPIFDANTAKIGLLRPELARDVAFIYGQITAFRASFHLLSKHHQNMSPDWSGALLKRCIEMIESNEAKAKLLIENLTVAAVGKKNLTTIKVWSIGAITLVSLSCLAAAIYCVWSASCFAH